MNTHNICFCGEIRKILWRKQKNIVWIPILIRSYGGTCLSGAVSLAVVAFTFKIKY